MPRKRNQALAELIGLRVRNARTLAGISTETLARAAGCTRQQINWIEQGKHQPSATVLLRVADALKVSADYLLGRPGVPRDFPLRSGYPRGPMPLMPAQWRA